MIRQPRVFYDPCSVKLDKSLAANDKHVTFRALLNPADGGSGNRGLESIADEAVKPRAGTDPQHPVAAQVETGDLITDTRARMIEDG